MSSLSYYNSHKKCKFCEYGYRPPEVGNNEMILCTLKDTLKYPNLLRMCKYYKVKNSLNRG